MNSPIKISPKFHAWLVDTTERTASAYGAAFFGMWLAPVAAAIGNGGDSVAALRGVVHTSVAMKAAVAAAPAAIVVVKSAVAALRRTAISPASLAPAQQPGQAEQDAPLPVHRHHPHPHVDPVTVAVKLATLPPPEGRKLGLRRTPPDPRDLRLTHYVAGDITVPTSHDWTRAVDRFPMLLNDQIGDCVVAGGLHMIQMWAANAGNPTFVPTDPEALAIYEHFGYQPGDDTTDQGIDPRAFLNYWRKTGIAGHQILGYVAVDPTDERQVAIGCYLGGGLFTGWNLPKITQGEGMRWQLHGSGPDAAPGSWGGHLAPIGGYGRRDPMITWGGVGTVTRGFRNRYCDVAWAVISPDWMDAAGVSPAGLSLTRLQKDLAAL